MNRREQAPYSVRSLYTVQLYWDSTGLVHLLEGSIPANLDLKQIGNFSKIVWESYMFIHRRSVDIVHRPIHISVTNFWIGHAEQVLTVCQESRDSHLASVAPEPGDSFTSHACRPQDYCSISRVFCYPWKNINERLSLWAVAWFLSSQGHYEYFWRKKIVPTIAKYVIYIVLTAI